MANSRWAVHITGSYTSQSFDVKSRLVLSLLKGGLHHLPHRSSLATFRRDSQGLANVVYFNQCLGAAHPKRCLKYAILTFLMAKSLKKQEICSVIFAKTHFFEFASKRWSTVLFP